VLYNVITRISWLAYATKLDFSQGGLMHDLDAGFLIGTYDILEFLQN
jgi:hypothetical protein